MKARNIVSIIINLYLAYIFLSFNDFIAMYLLLNVVFFIWALLTNEDNLHEKKVLFLIIGIVNLVTFKYITGTLSLISYSKLESDHSYIPKPKKKVDPQIKKLDILLKLGVLMVFIAGIIFASTSWYHLPSIIKIFILLLISILFIGLSKFSEDHIKIKTTIYLYWFLGLSFFFISVLMSIEELFSTSILYYELLFNTFKYLLLAFFCFITYHKFKTKNILYFVYISLVVSLLNLFTYFGFSIQVDILLLTLLFFTIKSIKINNDNDLDTLTIFSNIVTWCLSILFIICLAIDNNPLITIFLSLLFIFNIYSYINHHCSSHLSYIALPYANLLVVLPLIIVSDLNFISISLISSFSVMAFYIISLVLDSVCLKKSSNIFADIILFITLLLNFSTTWFVLLISVLLLITCISSIYIDNNSYQYNIHPLKISCLVLAILNIINSYTSFNLFNYFITISLLLFILLKKDKYINLYSKYVLVYSIIGLLISIVGNDFLCSFIVFISIILFYFSKKTDKNFNNISFILLLFNIFISFISFENELSLDTNYCLSNSISIILFILIGLLNNKDKFKLNAILYMITLPVISLIESIFDLYYVDVIINSILVYYLTIITVRLIKNDQRLKEVFTYLGLGYSYFMVVFTSNYVVLIYSFIILVISLIIGYFVKNNNAILKVSVIFFIIEIFYQLKEFWLSLPIWLYLLVVGLVIIIFVTNRQLKLINEKEKNDE